MEIDLRTTHTKIVCTIGPACRSQDAIRGMIRSGMDVARINFSHGSQDQHTRDIATIRQVAEEENATVAIMADLQGPKFRIGTIDPEPIILRQGTKITLTTRQATGKNNVITLPHPYLVEMVMPGDPLLLDDGALELAVEEKSPETLRCRVVTGGSLSSNKGIAAPNSNPQHGDPLSAITEKDKLDAQFALEQRVDFLALSFVRSAEDIKQLQAIIHNTDPANKTAVVAKIEKKEALDNLDDILNCIDAAMVARGDLGVEVSVQEVPLHQKAIIKRCNRLGLPVITATQMLQSMIHNPHPTRAEASDVANAILDGTDAVMLSGETAIGNYPVLAVETIAKISAIVEKSMLSRNDQVTFSEVEHRHPITDAISDATAHIAKDLNVRLIATSTSSGYTARQVAKERPREPIVAFTPDETVCRQLALVWGVMPILVPQCRSTDEMIQTMHDTVLETGLANHGDLIVITGGIPFTGGGQTNFINVHKL